MLVVHPVGEECAFVGLGQDAKVQEWTSNICNEIS
jgi:hypothetical protein